MHCTLHSLNTRSYKVSHSSPLTYATRQLHITSAVKVINVMWMTWQMLRHAVLSVQSPRFDISITSNYSAAYFVLSITMVVSVLDSCTFSLKPAVHYSTQSKKLVENTGFRVSTRFWTSSCGSATRLIYDQLLVRLFGSQISAVWISTHREWSSWVSLQPCLWLDRIVDCGLKKQQTPFVELLAFTLNLKVD